MICVILAGGSGVRFWPLSREQLPKQLLNLSGEDTLLQQTVQRLLPLTRIKDIYVVTNELHAHLTLKQLARFGFDPSHLLAEPCGRNTAPAIAWAARVLEHRPGEIMAVFPADHVMDDAAAFQATLKEGRAAAETGRLVTLGIRPTRPETGYGYIEAGEPLQGTALSVCKFTEKPDRETAQKWLEAGTHYWNCGIFLWKVGSILSELGAHLPEVHGALADITSHTRASDSQAPYRVLDDEGRARYQDLPSVSIDHGVLEKSKNLTVVPTDMPWSDVGSWHAWAELSPKDAQGNIAGRDVYLLDCTDSLVHSDHRLVGALGLHDLVIIDTEDALLVCPRSRAQEVKTLVERIRRDQRPEAFLHATVEKPWGSYTVLDEGEGYLLKRIEVLPGESLSLQSHRHRAEHWWVASGRAEVQCDGETTILEPGQSTFIPQGAKHRLGNPGEAPLVLIETQTGARLDENDITRYEDRYGRADS